MTVKLEIIGDQIGFIRTDLGGGKLFHTIVHTGANTPFTVIDHLDECETCKLHNIGFAGFRKFMETL